ncbi:hypothetical protein FEF65_09420 [Mariprofundus erugo]|uniref:Lipopolysaccharide biosynthesis protein n=1 Tax=Mariprofundus erugo TaxID=2528639 RepID=A0A5R9GP79_9PROT|nr:oligosaccharide flippase family protein [Mariprofundus erugo]TLS66729.1 hypothetical protein FEF65_09420 [Mariprofundus erugo]
MKNHFSKNVVIYFLGTMINSSVPFFLLPILTRVLSPEDYGIITIFTIVLSISGVFAGLSVHGAVALRYYKHGREGIAAYVGSCLAILIVTTIIMSLLIVLLGDYLSPLIGLKRDWILLAVILSGGQFLIQIRLTLWQVVGNAINYSAFQVSSGIMNAALSLLLILVLGMMWEGRLIAQCLTIAIFSTLALFWMWRGGLLSLPGTELFHHVKHALRYGVPLVPHVLGGMMIALGDRMIIESKMTTSDVGIYAVGAQAGLALNLLYQSFFKAWHPKIMERALDDSYRRRLLVSGSYKVMGGSLLLYIVFSLVAWFMYPYLVGVSFIEGQWIVLLIALSSFFGACYFSTAIYIQVANKNEYLAISTIFSGAVGLAVSYVLCDPFGMIGVALGVVVGQLLSFLLCWYAANLVFPMPWVMKNS